MGDRSGIEWTDATWNPTTGCDRVSPGCAHCYALDLAARLKGMGQAAYQSDGNPRTSGPGFALTLHPDRLDMPLRWTRPRRVFVNSMSDLFHEAVPDAFIDEVFAVMALCDGTRANKRDHTFQVLTKRPGRMRAYLTDPLTPWRVAAAICNRTVGFRPPIGEIQDPNPWEGKAGLPHENQWGARGLDTWSEPWPLRNVWLGTSVENQTWADRRIPELLATPAAVRFLSCEPLLGPVDLGIGLRVSWQCSGCRRFHSGHYHLVCPDCGRIGYWTGSHAFNRPDSQTGPGIGWVIAGGESGPEHRPVDPAWVRSLRDQCEAAGVPFLFKQWGGRTSKSGGRELDGRTHDGYPVRP